MYFILIENSDNNNFMVLSFAFTLGLDVKFPPGSHGGNKNN